MASLRIITAYVGDRETYTADDLSKALFPVAPGGQVVELRFRNQSTGWRADFGGLTLNPGQEIALTSQHLGLTIDYALTGIQSPTGMPFSLDFRQVVPGESTFRRLELIALLSI